MHPQLLANEGQSEASETINGVLPHRDMVEPLSRSSGVAIRNIVVGLALAKDAAVHAASIPLNEDGSRCMVEETLIPRFINKDISHFIDRNDTRDPYRFQVCRICRTIHETDPAKIAELPRVWKFAASASDIVLREHLLGHHREQWMEVAREENWYDLIKKHAARPMALSDPYEGLDVLAIDIQSLNYYPPHGIPSAEQSHPLVKAWFSEYEAPVSINREVDSVVDAESRIPLRLLRFLLRRLAASAKHRLRLQQCIKAGNDSRIWAWITDGMVNFVPSLTVIQGFVTRWETILEMLTRARRLRPALDYYAWSQDDLRPYALIASEWDTLFEVETKLEAALKETEELRVCHF